MEKANKIQDLYEKIKDDYNGEMCNRNTRTIIRERISSQLGEGFNVKCDEENNPPFIVDLNCVIAKVSYRNPGDTYGTYRHMNLVFGSEKSKEFISKYYNQ